MCAGHGLEWDSGRSVARRPGPSSRWPTRADPSPTFRLQLRRPAALSRQRDAFRFASGLTATKSMCTTIDRDPSLSKPHVKNAKRTTVFFFLRIGPHVWRQMDGRWSLLFCVILSVFVEDLILDWRFTNTAYSPNLITNPIDQGQCLVKFEYWLRKRECQLIIS